MIVQHNITAMNSNRMLGLTTNSLAKSTEKLSSGYRINRAADDAAGLSISEKMRKQIRGLDQASTNAEDGISAVQTAEGALNEVHSMLQRMNELAVQAANGTNSESDRTAIQNEIDQLSTEIDRVSETTKFNETYLLKGDRDATKQYSYKYNTFTADAIAEVPTTALPAADANNGTCKIDSITFFDTASADSQNQLAVALKKGGISVKTTGAWDATAQPPAAKDVAYSVTINDDPNGAKFQVLQTGAKTTINDKDGKKIAEIVLSGGKKATDATTVENTSKFTVTSVKAATKKGEAAKFYDKDGNGIPENALNNYFTVDANKNVAAKADAPKVYDAVGNQTELFTNYAAATQDIEGALTVKLHVGADATENNQIAVKIEAMSAKGLGVNGLKVDGTDEKNALGAIETIKESIQKVSNQRSALGAVQNRLEHTISNLDNVVENTTSAESRIRDTDMAEEMVNYSKNNILQQAGQSMLAQANQANQGVLSLLQ